MSRGAALLLSVLVAGGAAAGEVAVTFRTAVPDLRCEVVAFGRPLIVTEPVTVTLDAGDAAELTATSSGCWSEPVALPGESPLVELWPAAVVSGEVAVERGTQLPRAIRGTFVDADSKDAPEHPAYCSLDERSWRCSVPAGRPLHLRLSVDDYAPLYVWDVVAKDVPFDAGVHRLTRGASIAGRVIGDKPALALVPLTSAHQPAADRELTSLHAKADAKGWFQFTGVPPGRYRLVSKLAGHGDAVRELEVAANQELRLDEPLRHAPMGELEVLLTPPVSKSGRPWKVVLKRQGERMSEMVPAGEGSAGVDGIWTHAGLQPGAYLLMVVDAGSEVAHQLVELRGGPERVMVTISAIDVRGRILAGGKPVETTVRFDLIDATGRRVETRSAEDGAFALTFPVPGTWRPSVMTSSAQTTLPEVAIRSPHDEELLLELPGGRIKATVLDANGAAAPAALLLRRGGKTVASGLTDDDGTLELFGLAAGAYDAEAEGEKGFAGPVPVTIDEGEVAEVELRVSAYREVTGQVLAADGSAASGAIVRTLDDTSRSYDDTIADGRGVYSFRAKTGVEAVDVIVLAPPHPIALRRIAMVGKRNVSVPPIVLAPSGATLRVVPGGSIPPWPTLTSPHGRAYSLALLLAPRFGLPRWRELVDGAFQFTVEPGAYVVCSPDATCRPAQLAPNAETLINFVGPS